MIAISARRSYYVILTNQRLLVVANDRRSGGFGTIKLATRREAVTPTVLANRFFVKAHLGIQGSKAHGRAVHDVACQLADWAGNHRPQPTFDRDAVLFGVLGRKSRCTPDGD